MLGRVVCAQDEFRGFLRDLVPQQVIPPEARACGAFVGSGEARTGSAIASGAESEAVVRNQQPSSRVGVLTQGEQASSARIAR